MYEWLLKGDDCTFMIRIPSVKVMVYSGYPTKDVPS